MTLKPIGGNMIQAQDGTTYQIGQDGTLTQVARPTPTFNPAHTALPHDQSKFNRAALALRHG